MKRRIPTLAELPEAVSEGLTALANDAKPGPFGRKSLSQLVTDHLFLFNKLKRLGGRWPAIVRLLAECGIADGDDPLDADVLRATYSRAKRAASRANRATRTRRNKPKQSETSRNTAKPSETKQAEAAPTAAESVRPARNVPQRSKAERSGAERKLDRQRTSGAVPTDTVMPDASAPELPHPDPFKPSAADAEDFFRRAALTLKPLKSR